MANLDDENTVQVISIVCCMQINVLQGISALIAISIVKTRTCFQILNCKHIDTDRNIDRERETDTDMIVMTSTASNDKGHLLDSFLV